MRKFRDRKVSSQIPDGGLGTRAPKRRARGQQEAEFRIGFGAIEGVLAGGKQGRKFDQRRRSMVRRLPQEGATLLRGEPQRALAGLIIDLEQGPDTLEILLGNLSCHPVFNRLPILALAAKTEEPHLATLELQIQDVLPKPLDGAESRHRAGLLLRFARV